MSRLYKSTVDLKLHVIRIGKLMGHTMALHRPTSKQMTPAAVIVRTLERRIITTQGWQDLVMQRGESGPLPKAFNEGHRRRGVDIASARAWLGKRRVLKRAPKRTVFTLKRLR